MSSVVGKMGSLPESDRDTRFEQLVDNITSEESL